MDNSSEEIDNNSADEVDYDQSLVKNRGNAQENVGINSKSYKFEEDEKALESKAIKTKEDVEKNYEENSK